jgi:lipopolysaccharide export system permease protein
MVDYAVHILTKLHKKFYIYVLKELSYILLLSLGILTFILVLSRLGKMTDLVINKGVDVKDIVLLIVYSSPTYLTFTLPMAFLLSVIVVLGRLSTENEVLVLKASGVDLKCLFIPISAIALIITFCGLLNSNVLLPSSSELFRNTLINIIKKGISIEDKEGVFNDTIPGVVIYVDKVDVQKRILSGVMVSDDRDKDVKQTISASTGYINVDPATLDLHFVLENGNLHRWEKTRDAYRSVTFQNYTFSMNLSTMLPHSTELRKRSYEMDRSELQKSLLTAKENERYDIFLDIFKKISIPFSSLAFIFLTIPLGVKRRVEGKFSGILYSLLLFIVYYVLIAITDNFGRFINLPPFITSFTPNIIIAAMGLYLLRNLNEDEHSTISQKLRQVWTYCLEKTK